MDSWLRKEFENLSKDQLISFIEMSSKNFWTLQNNWVKRVEERYGDEVAIQLDGECYGRAIEVQAYRLKKMFGLTDDMKGLLEVLKLSLHGLYAEGVEYELSDKKLVRTVRNCPNQARRMKDGDERIPCKKAMIAAHTRIAKAVNPKIEIGFAMAPPDKSEEGIDCEIEYVYG